MTTLRIIAVAGIAVLMLSACSTSSMNLVYEREEDGKISVTAVAQAPKEDSIHKLIGQTDTAIDNACRGLNADQKALLPAPIWGAISQVNQLVSMVRSWVPMNTYTAKQVCS